MHLTFADCFAYSQLQACPFLYWASQHKTFYDGHHISVLGFPTHNVLDALYQVLFWVSQHTRLFVLSYTTPIIIHIAQIMSVSFAKFFSTTTHISSLPIDHTRGRASIVDGNIVYSPNCGRSVTRPLVDCDIGSLFNAKQPVGRLHQPLWWSLQTAFLAFLPVNFDLVGVP